MPRKVLVLHEALRGAGIGHAFGGALALAYYAEPRPTTDVDLNVFLPPAEWPRLREELRPLGVDVDGKGPDGDELRVRWDRLRLHFFFSSDRLHEAMEAAAREVPLGGGTVPILAAEHLVVRKALLDRGKDWVDIAAIAASTPLDLNEVERWLRELAGPGDERTGRVRALARR